MKALTICQPYPELILLPSSDPRHKRVENRTWPTNFRGMFYIHAGKSRDWLITDNASGVERDTQYALPVSSMAFGSIVGIARLVDCVRVSEGENGKFVSPKVAEKYPWLLKHKHTEGPWCWILDEITAIGPWPWKGAQGLWEVDEHELDRVANQILAQAQV